MNATYKFRGFTLIEVMVTLAIVAILATALLPLAQLSVQRNKESELKQALRDIRAALDAYKAAWEDGHISHRVGESGYPPSLEMLEIGVPDARSAAAKKIRFLRKLPRDPFAESQIPAEKTWGKRSYASEGDNPQEGEDVYDVYSLSLGIGLNGLPYRDW